MPGYNPNPGDLGVIIRALHARVSALETQQQSVISNLYGQPVIATGLSPGSNPPQYGFQLLSQAFGSEVGFYGEDSTGLSCLRFRNSSGDVVVQVDVDGFHVYDTTGAERVRMGPLTSGDYGLQVADASGTITEVWPQYSVYGAGPYTLSTAGTAALGLSFTAPVGASGKCFVQLEGLLISTATNGVNAELDLYVDGTATALNIQSYENNASYGPAQLTLSGRAQLTGLSAGSHTFAVYGSATYGCNAENVSIEVQPV